MIGRIEMEEAKAKPKERERENKEAAQEVARSVALVCRCV
jgi:hypothetical protein